MPGRLVGFYGVLHGFVASFNTLAACIKHLNIDASDMEISSSAASGLLATLQEALFGDYARERPFSAAAAAAAAVGAGVFLWSRRGQISEQISTLSDQLQEWNESRSETGMSDYDSSDSEAFMAKPKRGRKSQSEIAEEALTLKSTGGTNNRPLDETASNQTKAGAVAY